MSPCQYCSLPLTNGDSLCAQCMKSKPVFSAALCGFEYRFPVDTLIHRFKDNRHLSSGHVLTNLSLRVYRRQLQFLISGDSIVVPVPLHPGKQRIRGFNQSLLIANQVASSLSLQLEPRLISRTRHTADQKTLTSAERQANLVGAFHIHRKLNDERVILVDDVITTMATVSVVTTALLDQGAADVIVLALARTPSAAV